jgi:hypothetical protein
LATAHTTSCAFPRTGPGCEDEPAGARGSCDPSSGLRSPVLHTRGRRSAEFFGLPLQGVRARWDSDEDRKPYSPTARLFFFD